LKNFLIIGVAGYVAVRHLKAIKETGNNLLAALDKNDNVGILDNYFPDCHFFTEYERFERHCEKLKRTPISIDYVVVCTPNHLHDAHIRFGLRIGATVICEKPIVLNPWNLTGLKEVEIETGKKVFSILQLRLHPAIVALKKRIDNSSSDKIFSVSLSYIAPRGNWYHTSWKGDVSKSGGITTNIGVHFFDILLWIFGNVKESIVLQRDDKNASGKLKVEKATIDWNLSIEYNKLLEIKGNVDQKGYRKLMVDGEVYDLGENFTELHTQSYKGIFEGKGFGIDEVAPSINLIHQIRSADIVVNNK
jgi:UDP-N-acetyl-2-amino-2-deoxyglucuronate dehydrogenase